MGAASGAGGHAGSAAPAGGGTSGGSGSGDGSGDAGRSGGGNGSGTDAGPGVTADAGSALDAGASTVDCGDFPTFDRSCDTAADCALEMRQVDCCGTQIVTGVNTDAAPAFVAAASACQSLFPLCGCAGRATSADDGSVDSGGLTASVDCVDGACRTSFAGAVTACGPNAIACDTATEVCVAREPVGPAIVYECKPVPAACSADRTCGCLTSSLCTGGFDQCSDVGPNAIDCVCPLCQ